MSASSGKILISVESPAEQEVEHQKNARKLLRNVQNVPTMNKENVGKLTKVPAYLAQKELAKKTLFTDAMEAIELKRKKTAVQSQSCQTSPEKKLSTAVKPKITVEDLTSEDAPSEQYWEVLAERRRMALEESLAENMELYDKVHGLEEELSLSKEMLQEARNLVEVLTEMLQEGEAEKDEAGCSKDGIHQVDDSGVPADTELHSDCEDDDL